jgi:hypothetical protein
MSQGFYEHPMSIAAAEQARAQVGCHLQTLALHLLPLGLTLGCLQLPGCVHHTLLPSHCLRRLVDHALLLRILLGLLDAALLLPDLLLWVRGQPG